MSIKAFRACSLGLVFLASHAMVPDAQGATRYVGKSSCGGAGTSASPYCTIQQGLNSLKAGDTLLVRAGTYKEQLKLNETPELRSNVSAVKAELKKSEQ